MLEPAPSSTIPLPPMAGGTRAGSALTLSGERTALALLKKTMPYTVQGGGILILLIHTLQGHKAQQMAGHEQEEKVIQSLARNLGTWNTILYASQQLCSRAGNAARNLPAHTATTEGHGAALAGHHHQERESFSYKSRHFSTHPHSPAVSDHCCRHK